MSRGCIKSTTMSAHAQTLTPRRTLDRPEHVGDDVLGSAYEKLGIRSRAELAARLARAAER
jgi:hypothetical protein